MLKVFHNMNPIYRCKCGNHRRNGQRTCLPCHAANQRKYRAHEAIQREIRKKNGKSLAPAPVF